MDSKKTKIFLSFAQKKKIVKYASSSKLSQLQLATLFSKKFCVEISRRTIGDLLCQKDKWLEIDENDSRKIIKTPKYPSLDSSLYVWFCQMRHKNGILNQNILVNKAKKFGAQLNIIDFKFSNGWFENFKKRNKIKSYKLSGTAASTDLSNIKECLFKISSEISEFKPSDIFNMDETALFYDFIGDKTLSIQACTRGTKNSKQRITIALTCNANGTEKLPILVIGTAGNPRAFKNFSKQNYCQYYWNRKAWMTGEIFKNWLFQLDEQFKKQARKIVLLLDNAPGHVDINESLTNIRLIFFDPNLTTHIQPLDQGIIQNFKVHYKNFLMDFIIDCIENNETKKCDLSMVIIWSYNAWQRVTPLTITNCWNKTGIVEYAKNAKILNVAIDTNEINDYLENKKHFKEIGEMIDEFQTLESKLSTSEFLNDEEILRLLGEDEEKSEIFQEESVKVSHTEASKAVILLETYLKQQEGSNPKEALMISHLRHFLDQNMHGKQTKIDEYFNKI